MENVEFVSQEVEDRREKLKQIARDYLGNNRALTEEDEVVPQKDVREWWNKRMGVEKRDFSVFYSIVRKEMKKQQRKLRKERQTQYR